MLETTKKLKVKKKINKSSELPAISILDRKGKEIPQVIAKHNIVEDRIAENGVQIAETFHEAMFSSGTLKISGKTTKSASTTKKVEVFYVLSGKIILQIDELEMELEKGAQFFIPATKAYKLRNPASPPCQLVFFKIE